MITLVSLGSFVPKRNDAKLTKMELHADDVDVLLECVYVENGAPYFGCFSEIESSLETFPSPFDTLFIDANGGCRTLVSFLR